MDWSEAGYKRLIRGQTRGVPATLARGGLAALSLPYALGVWCRNLAFDRGWRTIVDAPIPVISVGNLTVGGTGKTPVVALLARRLRDRGARVAILSRGYGANDGANDEALVLEQCLPDVPHLQGHDRAELAQIAADELESQILILDDGFQHRRLERDLDIVLLDATDPFGGGRLLPAGLLRESPGSLRRADLILATRAEKVSQAQLDDLLDAARRWAPGIPIGAVRFEPRALFRHGGPGQELAWLRGQRIVAFCGIGNPDSFWRTLGELGAEVRATRPFGDHHAYSRAEVEELAAWAGTEKVAAAVTTQKDHVKLPIDNLGGVPLYSLRIEAVIQAGAELVERALDNLLARIEKSI